jgi:hypothetical protein
MGASSPPLVWRPPTLPSRISRLSGAIEGITAAPTPPQLAELEELSVQVRETESAVDRLVEIDLAELNRILAAAGVPHIRIRAPRPDGRTPLRPAP